MMTGIEKYKEEAYVHAGPAVMEIFGEEPFVPAELVDRYRDAYRQADKVIFFDLANEASRNFLGEGFEVGFSARPFDPVKVKEIRDAHDKPIVVITCGASNSGFDFDIDVGLVARELDEVSG